MTRKKLKLAFVAPGSIGHTLKWVNGLVDQGIEVTLITQHTITATISDKVNVVYLPYKGGRGYILNAFALHNAIKCLSPDVINVHYASGYGTLALLACIKPYILSVWGSDVYEFPFQSKFKHWLITKNLLNAQKIASTSCAMAEQVRIILKQPNLDITITPFGVNLSHFNRTQKPFNEKIITIGVVKKLEHKYGMDILINAFALVQQQCQQKEIRLLIVGDGSLEGELKEIAKLHKIIKQVSFVGVVPNTEVPSYINEIDIFVVPSRIESFGVAAIEALGCERPCIVTNVGGLPEVIIDEVTGVVVESESEIALAKAIISFIENQALAIELGVKGRTDVLQKYSEPATLDIMVNLYKKFHSNHVS